jgi:uncharacterized protein YgiM (DUF1202 family)
MYILKKGVIDMKELKLSLRPLFILITICVIGIIFSIVYIDKEIDKYIEDMKTEINVEVNNVEATVDVVEEDNKINVIVNESEEPITQKYESIKVISESGLNIRQEPTIDSNIIGVLYYGAEINILEESDEWYKIDGGYIFKEYVVKI